MSPKSQEFCEGAWATVAVRLVLTLLKLKLVGCFWRTDFGQTGLGVFRPLVIWAQRGLSTLRLQTFFFFFFFFRVATLSLPLQAGLGARISVCGSCLGLAAALEKLRIEGERTPPPPPPCNLETAPTCKVSM